MCWSGVGVCLNVCHERPHGEYTNVVNREGSGCTPRGAFPFEQCLESGPAVWKVAAEPACGVSRECLVAPRTGDSDETELIKYTAGILLVYKCDMTFDSWNRRSRKLKQLKNNVSGPRPFWRYAALCIKCATPHKVCTRPCARFHIVDL